MLYISRNEFGFVFCFVDSGLPIHMWSLTNNFLLKHTKCAKEIFEKMKSKKKNNYFQWIIHRWVNHEVDQILVYAGTTPRHNPKMQCPLSAYGWQSENLTKKKENKRKKQIEFSIHNRFNAMSWLMHIETHILCKWRQY